MPQRRRIRRASRTSRNSHYAPDSLRANAQEFREGAILLKKGVPEESSPSIPADQQEPDREHSYFPLSPSTTGSSCKLSSGHVAKSRVLLVNDNSEVRRRLFAMLRETYDVSVAADGKAALSAIHKRIPDLVLVDVLESFALLRALRSEPATEFLPVIVISAQGGGRESGKPEGQAVDYLLKPVCRRELLARVALQLELVRLRRELLKRNDDVVADLVSRLLHAQEDERTSIARRLHENIGQHLASLTLGLHELKRRMSAHSSTQEILQAAVFDLLRMASAINTDVRELSDELHSTALQYLGLNAALNDLCRRESQHHHVKVDFDADQVTLSDQASLGLYRVAQEALSNALSHGKAGEISVQLSRQAGGTVLLSVKDAGIGFDVTTSARGPGLLHMSEHLRALGGELTVKSAPGQGTEIIAELPVAQAAQ